MTGREFILYILSNNLENEQLFDKDGTFIGFMTVEEAAFKFGVGSSTVNTWILLGRLRAVMIGNKMYIPVNAELKEVSDAV